ncbi:MAG: hypothetical protein AB1744_10480 [Candidatus Zixiibacteriota bacterium]
MNKLLILIGVGICLLCGQALAQEVVISGFPVGVAGSVEADFFQPYMPQLRAVADTLKKYPLVQAIVTGSADGHRYRLQNDAKNPGLALGRAHLLAKLLTDDLKVDSAQLIIQSQNVPDSGAAYRFASVRVLRGLIDLEAKIDAGDTRINARIDSLENRPPVEKHFTEIKEVPTPFKENFGLQLGAGFSSSPFGGMPIVSASATWRQYAYLEVVGGHSLWKTDYRFEDEDLDTRRRMLGGHITVFPFDEIRLGFVGGWMRVEQISQFYFEYVRLSEGPLFGVRFDPADFISIVGAYNPAKRRTAGIDKSDTDTDQFLIYATLYKLVGGGK